ncbi:MAG: cohesin domain-containing protein [Candidatus Levyibacteriota bacterium]
MSKITVALLMLLLIAVGVFFFIKDDSPDNAFMTSLTHPSITQTPDEKTTLSMTSALTSVRAGQTISVTVLINNQDLKPTLAQLELAYDPTVLTATNILPGMYFTKPTIALQNISLDTGRISYALRCPLQQNSITATDCANAATNNLATVTFQVNPYTTKSQTKISFLPKTIVHSKNGINILGGTTSLSLHINGASLPVEASSSGQIIPTPSP